MTDDGLPLFAVPPPDGFVRRVVVVAPHTSRPYRAAEWDDALVVVQRGALTVEGLDGSGHELACGDVLWLADVPARALRNDGDEPAVLVAVARAAPR